MTTEYLKWKIYCITDSQYEYIWDDVSPTVCPVNGGHSVDTNQVSKESIIDVVTLINTDSPYSLGQRSVLCDTTLGSITINLPTASRSKGAVVLIKKIATGNTVTVDADGSDLIDASATAILTSLSTSLLF